MTENDLASFLLPRIRLRKGKDFVEARSPTKLGDGFIATCITTKSFSGHGSHRCGILLQVKQRVEAHCIIFTYRFGINKLSCITANSAELKSSATEWLCEEHAARSTIRDKPFR